MSVHDPGASGTGDALGLPPTGAAHSQGEAYARAEALLERPMMALTLLFAVAFLAEECVRPRTALWYAATTVGWGVWACFAAEYVTLLYLARDRPLFARTHLLDAAIVLLPPLRVARLGRLARLTRLVRLAGPFLALARGATRLRHVAARRGTSAALATATLLLFAGALVVHRVEAPANEQFATYGASLWWAVVTVTSVGYGDIAPVTAWGRVIAAGFMVMGVAVFGLVAATVAAYFVGEEQRDEQEAVLAHLDRLSARLERIEQRLGSPDGGTAEECPKVPETTARTVTP